MGRSKAPQADPNIGIAALKSAELGEKHLEWMKGQAEITNQWASEDRADWREIFKPIRDEYVRDAKNWDTPQRRQQAQREAIADVRMQGRVADGSRIRQAMAMGINPNSGKFLTAQRDGANDMALAAVGAGNMARDRIEAQGEQRVASAINMGAGLGVNPAQSMQISNGAASSGFNGAMQGYGQQGSLLNTQFQQQMQAYEAKQSSRGSLFGAIGSVAGMANWGKIGATVLPMLSSKKAKTNKKPIKDGAGIEAVRKMPVEQWDYKPGMGDGGRHVGAYAEDFQKATGQGDGKTIDIPSYLGTLTKAVQDIDKMIRSGAAGGKSA
ncbi:tail fiber domain-containing protein [Paracoccus sp. NSM]|uniref:tail fiber domain-containing protein n=1 Tax=Paracoccus sp. NSM TaxID=3457784 RepID=UPI0040364B12